MRHGRRERFPAAALFIMVKIVTKTAEPNHIQVCCHSISININLPHYGNQNPYRS